MTSTRCRRNSLCFLWLSFFPFCIDAHIRLERIVDHALEVLPYQWTMIYQLFDSQQSFDLATSYPSDHYKTVEGYDGEKGYFYEVRAFIPMGKKEVMYSDQLSPGWRQLAEDLLSDEYRQAISQLMGIDLSSALMEVNIFQYGQGAWMGPHVDLKEKIVTHVLYFNSQWDLDLGGGLAILASKNLSDTVFVVPPIIGCSSVIVRSNHSWHAVLPILEHCKTTRKSMTVTFYHPNSISTMWPPGERVSLHSYSGMQ